MKIVLLPYYLSYGGLGGSTHLFFYLPIFYTPALPQLFSTLKLFKKSKLFSTCVAFLYISGSV